MSLKPLHISLTIPIPEVLEKLLMSLSLAYHRLRYGHSVGLIPVGQGKYAIVDADDYERLSKYKWQLCRSRHTYYAFRETSARGGKKRQRILMHREIIDIPEGMVCDHANRKSLDNRKANVRPATVAQNSCNTRRRVKTTSRYRGVSQAARSNKWRAQIRVNGRSIHLGMFDDEVDAAKAYDAAARKYHGEFAVLNFPDRPPSRILMWICGFLATIAGRIKQSLRTRAKAESNLSPSHCEAEGGNHPQASLEAATRPKGRSNDATSPRAKSRGLLKQISPLASLGRNDGMWAALRPFGRNDNDACSSFSAKHRFSICEFFEKLGQNSLKVGESRQKIVIIAQKYAIMNVVQMARGP